MARSAPRRVPGPVLRPPRSRPDLEARIPAKLRNLPRVCPHEGCGSDNVRIRYFDNKRGAACKQPRFLCYSCGKTFTLGGKLRDEYKKSKKKAETGRKRGKSSGAAARRAPRRRASKPIAPSSPAATESDSSEEDVEERAPEQEIDSATNSADKEMSPAEEAESEPDAEENPVLSRNLNDHRREVIERDSRKIDKELLKLKAMRHLLHTLDTLGDIYLEKGAMVVCEAKLETVRRAAATMYNEVQAMDVERVPHSAMVQAKKRAKRLRDRAVKLAE